MMKYERLTERAGNGKALTKGCETCHDYCFDCEHAENCIDRLAELEDKIEQNELLSIEDIAKLWDKLWGAPCEYEICGENAIDVIWKHTDYNWCERKCGTVDSALCWEEYLKAKLKELQG